MLYFAYGTNMNPELLARKQLAFTSRQRAVLEGHGLRFNKRSGRDLLPPQIGFANIVPAPGETVEGVLYELPDRARARLDELERCPEHYERVTVTVETDGGPQRCETYRAQAAHTAEGLVPSKNYVNHILAARDVLSPGYRARLERIQTYAGKCAVCHQPSVVLFLKEDQRMFTLCAPCIESRRVWGDALGRKLRVSEAEAVVQKLQRTGRGYPSIAALIEDAIRSGLIAGGAER